MGSNTDGCIEKMKNQLNENSKENPGWFFIAFLNWTNIGAIELNVWSNEKNNTSPLTEEERKRGNSSWNRSKREHVP